MSNFPPVSVIIPVYNGERFLAEAIESVRAQNYAPLEIIIVDDGSTDGTAAVVRQLGNDIHYVYQANAGPAAARNTGLELARGELIAFLDVDDVWTTDKLLTQVACLQANPAIQYTIGRVTFFLDEGCQIPSGFRPEWLTQEPVAYLLQNMVVRRQLFDQVGLFDPAMSPAEDTDWFARVFDADIPGHVVPRVLLRKRVHAANISLNMPDTQQRLLAVVRRSVLRKQKRGPF